MKKINPSEINQWQRLMRLGLGSVTVLALAPPLLLHATWLLSPADSSVIAKYSPPPQSPPPSTQRPKPNKP